MMKITIVTPKIAGMASSRRLAMYFCNSLSPLYRAWGQRFRPTLFDHVGEKVTDD